jgi:peptidyl-prolyl cis-trans isomerase A (cyclophilin A)
MNRFFSLVLCLLLYLPVYTQEIPDQSVMMSHAPPKFTALFKTTKGDFSVEVTRELSPAAADRIYQLIMTGFFNDNCLFRVQKDYVVQFGICDRKDVNYFWDKRPVPDEPVKTGNLKGNISFARDGMNSRTSQLFINLKDNPKLDTVNYNGLRGFPPVGKVISGIDAINSLFSGYGFEPANHQDSLMIFGNAYMKKKFPGLDYIIRATVTGE